MRRVAVVGTGRVGTRLAEQLVIDHAADAIYLWNRSQDKLNGVITALGVWRPLISSKVQIDRLAFDQINAIDLLVLAIKERYDPRQLMREPGLPDWLPTDLRYIGCMRDLPSVVEVATKLQSYRGIVLVLTNPVDVFTTLIGEMLPNATVLGAGLTLDAARFQVACEEMFGVPAQEFTCPLGGEHGGILVPLKGLWMQLMGEAKTREVLKHVKEIEERARGYGVRIVEDLGFTCQDCAVVVSKDIGWLLSDGADAPRCFSVRMKNESVSIGRPIQKRYGPGFDLTPCLGADETEAIEVARARVESVVAGMKTEESGLIST